MNNNTKDNIRQCPRHNVMCKYMLINNKTKMTRYENGICLQYIFVVLLYYKDIYIIDYLAIYK